MSADAGATELGRPAESAGTRERAARPPATIVATILWALAVVPSTLAVLGQVTEAAAGGAGAVDLAVGVAIALGWTAQLVLLVLFFLGVRHARALMTAAALVDMVLTAARGEPFGWSDLVRFALLGVGLCCAWLPTATRFEAHARTARPTREVRE